MSTIGKLIVAGAMPVIAAGGVKVLADRARAAGNAKVRAEHQRFADWTKEQSKHLPVEQQGCLEVRMKEITEGGSFHDHTAKHHRNLVASLPSKAFVEKQKYVNDEKEIMRSLQEKRYGMDELPYDLYPTGTPPYFTCQTDWQQRHVAVFIPDMKTENGYTFTGDSAPIYDSRIREKIIKGEYLRCPSQHQKADLLVVNTRDPKDCGYVRRAFLKHIVLRAAAGKLDPNHPYADTIVTESKGSGPSEYKGDLTNLSPRSKELIKKNLMECFGNGYDAHGGTPRTVLRKTKDGTLKEVHAIELGREYFAGGGGD